MSEWTIVSSELSYAQRRRVVTERRQRFRGASRSALLIATMACAGVAIVVLAGGRLAIALLLLAVGAAIYASTRATEERTRTIAPSTEDERDLDRRYDEAAEAYEQNCEAFLRAFDKPVDLPEWATMTPWGVVDAWENDNPLERGMNLVATVTGNVNGHTATKTAEVFVGQATFVFEAPFIANHIELGYRALRKALDELSEELWTFRT